MPVGDGSSRSSIMLITSILKPSAIYVRVYTHRCRLMPIKKKLIFFPFFKKKQGEKPQEKRNIYLIIDLSIDGWNVAFFCVYIFLYSSFERRRRRSKFVVFNYMQPRLLFSFLLDECQQSVSDISFILFYALLCTTFYGIHCIIHIEL